MEQCQFFAGGAEAGGRDALSALPVHVYVLSNVDSDGGCKGEAKREGEWNG